MTIHVLLINRQLVFAVTIKQALEQTGAFEVHPFTSADPAIEYLRAHPHEVALVDFTLPDGPKIIQRLRALQPEIAVIVSPSQPDASTLIRDLRLQAIVDAPFSARSIIPLIEHAVEQIVQPFDAVTRNLPGSSEDASGETEVLPGEKASKKELPEPTPPTAVRKKPIEPLKPRVLDTNSFEPKPPAPPKEEPALPKTRVLNDKQLPPATPATRVISSGEDKKKIKPLGSPASPPPLPPRPTPPAPVPPTLPEFSSLDDIIADEEFDLEPPIHDGDTPAVPAVDFDAVRQFLATKPRSGDNTFDHVLGTIDPAKQNRPAASSFDDLVNSMRSQERRTALPDRHQQFIDFILTGGMEHLLTEIEKAKVDTDPPVEEPAQATSSFEKLAQEEPPMPTLEESGTVGDLMIGVSDTGFRNVLAMMSGDEVIEESDESRQRLSKEMEEAFAAFFEQQTSTEDSAPFFEEKPRPAPKPIPPQPQRDEGAIPARLILETTQEESTSLESFSLNSLIDSIDRQLSEHTPDVQPLPSWGKNVKLQLEQRRKVDDRYIKEPDFLPEEFSTSQMVPVNPAEAVEQSPETLFEPDFLPEQDALQSMDAERPPVVMPAWDDIAQWDVAEAEIPDDETLESVERVEYEAAPSSVVMPEWDDIAQWDATQPDIAEEDFDAVDDWADVTILGEPVTPTQLWAEEEVPPDEPAVARERPPLDHDFFMHVDELPDEPTVMMPRVDEWALPESAPQAEALQPVELEYTGEYEEQGEDPYVAQIALSLTQVSLELTADATILARNGEIIATAGSLTREDIEEFRMVIGDQWEAEGDDARIRFIRLPSSSRDYMLYSRKTAGDFTLSMIFSTNTPLRDIRRQGKRLLEALETVPDVVPEVFQPPTLPEAVADEQPAALPAVAQTPDAVMPFAYVWLSNAPLSDVSTRAIQTGLRVQLRELGWQVSNIEAQGEYVYILADVPGEQPAYEVVRDLKRRAAAVVHTQHPEAAITWTDGYLVMTPGRPLEADEIEQFIRFERLQ